MGNSIVKHFTAEAEIKEFTPVKQGSKEGMVVPATSPFDYVMGVAQNHALADEGVDVMILGESFVDCEGAVDGTAPITANANGRGEQFKGVEGADAEGKTLVCVFARPIEIDTNDAYLRCIVCPSVFSIGAQG